MSENANTVHLNETGTVAFLPAYNAVVTGLPGRPAASTKHPAASPTEPVIKRELSPGDEKIVFWGDDNAFPQRVAERYRKNMVIPETLDKKAALWLGGGVIATADEESETMVKDPQIRTFLRDITTQRYLRETAKGMAWYINGFPEFIISKDRSQIVQLHANETSYCRWGRMNEYTGAMDKVYLNANWPLATSVDPGTLVIDAINPYAWDAVDLVKRGDAFKYIYPISYPSEGSSYYQLANHHSVISSGWLDVLEAIPQFKKFALKNQMSLKYHIEVPTEYWERVYGERWDGPGTNYDTQKGIRDEFLSDMASKLSDVENTQKSLLTDTWYDPDKNLQGVKINVLKDPIADGKYNEDYSEGLASLFYTLGWDPTMSGFASKEMGSRSGGSDKREAFWIFLTASTPYRQAILEPLQFVAKYNGWLQRWPELTFKFIDTPLTTLDTGKSTATSKTPVQ